MKNINQCVISELYSEACANRSCIQKRTQLIESNAAVQSSSNVGLIRYGYILTTMTPHLLVIVRVCSSIPVGGDAEPHVMGGTGLFMPGARSPAAAIAHSPGVASVRHGLASRYSRYFCDSELRRRPKPSNCLPSPHGTAAVTFPEAAGEIIDWATRSLRSTPGSHRHRDFELSEKAQTGDGTKTDEDHIRLRGAVAWTLSLANVWNERKRQWPNGNMKGQIVRTVRRKYPSAIVNQPGTRVINTDDPVKTLKNVRIYPMKSCQQPIRTQKGTGTFEKGISPPNFRLSYVREIAL